MARRRSGGLLAAAVFLAGGAAFVLLSPVARPPAHEIGRADYDVYVPSAAGRDAASPLVIALSPSGDTRQMIEAWRPVADELGWVVLASRRFRNGIPGEEEWRIFRDIASAIGEGSLPVAIDRRHVVVAGFSGGGMGAHAFAFFFPDAVCCVVANTGMMDAEYSYPRTDAYPRDRIAVFLASPTDFRYGEMKRDRQFLDALGWRTAWIEFDGGHIVAPPGQYRAAARFIVEQWNAAPRSGPVDATRD